MKDIIFILINFLLLCGIVIFFGRKIIIKIFRTRRERVYKELDEAENTFYTEEIPENDISEQMRKIENAAKIRMDDIIEKEEGEKLFFEKRLEHDFDDQRREMLYDTRQEFLDKLKASAQKLLASEPYVSMLRAYENEIADVILSQITLTPGDMTYLKTHDVLYVTLTSAFPLDNKIVEKIREKSTKILDEVGGIPSFWYKNDETLIGGLRLRIGDTIYDGTVEDALYHMKKRLDRRPISRSDSAETIVKSLMEGIGEFSREIDVYQRGRAISVSDGICWLDGLADIMYGEVIEFACGEKGMVLDIEANRIGCVVFNDYEKIESGSSVRRVGRIASVPVGEELIGRVLNALGTPIDGKKKLWMHDTHPIEFPAPEIISRKSVGVPMHTGIKAIDSMIPIGRGQRELIIGDRQTGKSAIAIDAILNQKDKNVICVYVAIGQKEATVAQIYDKLFETGAMKYSIIVAATASDSASLQYIAPFTGTAIGEYFMYSGRDVLIVYDDLSKHAVAYRELSLLLHRPSGREAYPGDVFYLHARLLERSARLSDEYGGGSMTALPIIETQAGDISSYIPTNVISITDGQIFLETGLFNEGQRPAVNVGLSVSRVGSAAQTKLMKQVSSSLRMNLAQYRELANFAQFGTELDESSQKILDSGKRMMAVLCQGRYKPLDDAEQAVVIYAVSEGFADGFEASEMEKYQDIILSHLKTNYPALMEKLGEGNKMDEQTLSELRSALSEAAVNA